MNKLRIVLASALLFVAATLGAQTLRENVSLRINHEDGLYQKGEQVTVWADVKAVPEGEVFLYIKKNGIAKPISKDPITLNEGENIIFDETIDETAQYVFEITDGVKPNAFKDPDAQGNSFIGVVVDPDGFELGFKEPDDLLSFWNDAIKKMRKKKIKTDITNDKTEDGYRTYHVDINCVGPAPARAYVSHPADAAKKSLPIILNLHSAGSPGAPSKASESLRYAKYVKGGALAMDLNAHGMLDDQDKEFYKELSKGELKGYSSREPVDKDDYYFKWMLLRAQRALDYLTQDPLWDGEHIIVTGASQGGYQSIFLAGIDPRVTTAIVTVPAGLDQGAALIGRASSWPYTFRKYPESTKQNSPYFDAALLLKYTKANIWCEIGLYDFTCPACNLFAALNTFSGEKTIVTYQRPHSLRKDQKEAHKPIDKLRRKAFNAAAVK